MTFLSVTEEYSGSSELEVKGKKGCIRCREGTDIDGSQEGGLACERLLGVEYSQGLWRLWFQEAIGVGHHQHCTIVDESHSDRARPTPIEVSSAFPAWVSNRVVLKARIALFPLAVTQAVSPEGERTTRTGPHPAATLAMIACVGSCPARAIAAIESDP